jgi:glyoxylase-like metal-dependent hydrolase (beta-lactamase superfamily II)
MNVLTYQVGSMQANCYFLVDSDKNTLIIDPGDSADFLLEEVSRLHLHVEAIVATHGHFDHIMAAGEMQMALQVPFYIHKDDVFLLSRVEETARHFLGFEPFVIKPQHVVPVVVGDWPVGSFDLEVVHVPGHTPGSVCLYSRDVGCVFVGDLVFQGGSIGRYDFSYSDKTQLIQSIDRLNKQLPGETIVYSGHGESSILEDEMMLLQELGIVKNA